jgi:hypothetical protein
MPTTRKKLRPTRQVLDPQKHASLEARDKEYETFIQGLQLIDLGLKSCSASLDRRFFFDALNKEKRLMRDYRAGYVVADLGEHHFDFDAVFSVALLDSKGRKALNIECTFEVHMHSKLDPAKRFLDRFSENELALIAVPFARQFILDTTARMSVPPIIIPLTTRRAPPPED